jgi:hypothetical protein
MELMAVSRSVWEAKQPGKSGTWAIQRPSISSAHTTYGMLKRALTLCFLDYCAA